MSRRLNLTQCARVHLILNDERRALLGRVRRRVRSIQRTDPFVARELLRIAETLHGFGHRRQRG